MAAWLHRLTRPNRNSAGRKAAQHQRAREERFSGNSDHTNFRETAEKAFCRYNENGSKKLGLPGYSSHQY